MTWIRFEFYLLKLVYYGCERKFLFLGILRDVYVAYGHPELGNFISEITLFLCDFIQRC